MNLFRYATLILALTCAIALPVTAARAQTVIGVVDVRALMNDSKAAQSIQEQLTKHREKFLAELSKQEQKLREQEQELAKAQASMEKEEFSQKVKDFEANKLKTRQLVQDQKRALDEGIAEATNTLRTEIFKVVETLSEEKGYDLIITRQNVVVGAKSLDITDEAMKALNKSLSSVKVTVK